VRHGDVAPDGSPVEVYRALDGGPDLDVVLDAIPPGASVLDLGSGPGRIANPLARAGHDVVAVDDSQAMLDHVESATTVLADLWTLDLGRTFDVVLALSHLINDPGRARRVQLLEVCARHVARDGVVLVQRLPLGWMPAEERRTVGDVTVHMHDVQVLPNGFRASNTYTVEDRSWTQAYESEWVDDTELDGCATIAGLRVDRVLDDHRWIVLRPAR
jgi:SAM-dependent methyltransferase